MLKPFQDNQFKKEEIERAYRALRSDREVEKKFFLVTISGGGIRFSEDEVDTFTAACKLQLLRRLTRMQYKVPLPNAIFVFSSLAALSQIGNSSTTIPIFSACGGETDFQRMLVPRAAPHWTSKGLANQSTTDFEGKEKKLFFRGSLSGFERAKLFKSFSNESKFVDIAMTGVPDGAPCDNTRARWCPGLPDKWVTDYGLKKGEYFSMIRAANTYRYILSVDGVGCADRLPALLSSNMVVFKAESRLEEFWYYDLVPFVHYIPVKSDFSDLTSKIRAVLSLSLSHQKQIVASANQYVQLYLSEDSLDCYMTVLLSEYAYILN